MKPTFDVTLRRHSIETVKIRVRAESENEAGEMALTSAVENPGRHHWEWDDDADPGKPFVEQTERFTDHSPLPTKAK